MGPGRRARDWGHSHTENCALHLLRLVVPSKEISSKSYSGQLKCIFALYNSIHAEGVAHQDIACRNMRIVWNRQAGTDPRVVIFDFDRVKFGRDDRSIFRKEETTLNRFLLELGAWQNGDVVTSWLEEGDGKLLYRNFGSNLLTSQGTQFRAQELAYMEMCRTQNVEEERAERTKTAWREIYDSQFKSNWPLEQALVTGPTTQEVPRLTDEELALQQSNNN